MWVFRLNPMAHLINAYRDIFYLHNIPNITNILIVIGVSLIFLFVSYKIYKKLERGFAEEL